MHDEFYEETAFVEGELKVIWILLLDADEVWVGI